MSDSPQLFVQKTGRMTLSRSRRQFEFGENALNYTITDRSGERMVTIPYDGINLELKEALTVNNASKLYRLLAILLCIIFLAGHKIFFAMTAEEFQGIFTCAIGVCVGISLIARPKAKYTIFNSNNGKIWVIQNEQHDAIIAALKAHQIARLRKLHWPLPPFQNPAWAVERLGVLRKKEIISEQEYQETLKNISSISEMMPLQNKPVLN